MSQTTSPSGHSSNVAIWTSLKMTAYCDFTIAVTSPSLSHVVPWKILLTTWLVKKVFMLQRTRPFWKSAILKMGNFGFFFFKKERKFGLIPMKTSHILCDRMNGTQFWCFPLFPANSLLCVIIRCTVYVNTHSTL